MKIVDVEVIELRVPGWAGGTFDGSYDDCLVVVHTDAGLRHFGSGLKAIKIVDDPFWRDDLDKTAELISAAGPRVSCGFSPACATAPPAPVPIMSTPTTLWWRTHDGLAPRVLNLIGESTRQRALSVDSAACVGRSGVKSVSPNGCTDHCFDPKQAGWAGIQNFSDFRWLRKSRY